MNKKIKIFLLTSSALITNTIIANALTSCSSRNIIVDTGGFDKLYGISMATYNRMESDFRDLYETQQNMSKYEGSISEEEYQSNLLNFESKLNSFHANLFDKKDNKTLSYTIKTNTLRDFARKNYGIRLSRVNNINLDDELTEIKGSMMHSLLFYLEQCHIVNSDTYQYVVNANKLFDSIVDEAKEKWDKNDAVSLIQYVQEHTVSCFAGITKEIDALITQRQLKEFIEEYPIKVKENISSIYCWDKLYSYGYNDGIKEITTNVFNNLFDMYVETTPRVNTSTGVISTKTIKFDDDLIPGYTLKPFICKMHSDPYTNTYSIDVDYTLVNNQYINDTDVAKLTAHSSSLKHPSLYKDEPLSIFDLNTSEDDREYTNYQIPVTKKYEKNQINQTYFNGDDFKISWSTSEEYGFDDFWVEPNENGECKATFDKSALASSGMMINGYLLLDILEQSDSISLSGGSVFLNGKEKLANTDLQQWKLSIDKKELASDAIKWELVSATSASLPNAIFIDNGVVSWTDAITVGTYEFYVVANYKGKKFQTQSITLAIEGNKKNALNYNSKKVYSTNENVIDQKLIDFVKNINFYLDYTEVEYSKAYDDFSKGEIQINDFIVNYVNSENSFSIDDKTIINPISIAINEDSGITKRYSENLWEKVTENYNGVVSITNMDNLKKSVEDEIDEIDNLEVTYAVMYSVFTVFFIALVAAYFIIAKMGVDEMKMTHFEWIFVILPAVLIILGMIAGIISVFAVLESPRDELVEKINKLNKDTNDSSNYKLLENINNDKKYFVDKDGKSNFNSLPPAEIKNKKSYYELGYKQDKINNGIMVAESDLAVFFGGKNEVNEFANNLNDLIDSFKYMHILNALCAILMLWFILIVLGVIGATYSNHLKTLDDEALAKHMVGYVKQQDAWLNKNGILQISSDIYNRCRFYWIMFFTW